MLSAHVESVIELILDQVPSISRDKLVESDDSLTALGGFCVVLLDTLLFHKFLEIMDKYCNEIK